MAVWSAASLDARQASPIRRPRWPRESLPVTTEFLPAAPAPRFAGHLPDGDRQVIVEELGILAGVHAHLAARQVQGHRTASAQDMLDLRDALGEAREEDVPQILAMMESLAQLAEHREQEQTAAPVRRASPYFAHIRIEQDGHVRDVLIGNGSLLDGGLPYPIVDWRHSPISKLFYGYREGETYEEEFGGRAVCGEVLLRRTVTIRDGALVQIHFAGGQLTCTQGVWERGQLELPALRGGAGQAVRAETVHSLRLGLPEIEAGRNGRFLPEITALIDSGQFDLITRPETGVVVIDGGAGSGKTTIALHRIAYLAFRDPVRFRPGDMLIVVFNPALARYISRLLPALGVEGVRIEVFEEFAHQLRRRHYPALIAGYEEQTPYSVVRFKQHPAVLTLLKAAVARRERELLEEIGQALHGTESAARMMLAWEGLAAEPLAIRIERLLRWASGKISLPQVGAFGQDWIAQRRLVKVLTSILPDPNAPFAVPLAIWEDAFLRREALAAAVDQQAPGQFSAAHLEEIHGWALRADQQREIWRQWQETRRVDEDGEAGRSEEGESKPEPPLMDREDDTLLLLLYQMLVGPLRGRKARPLRVSHLMVDEAQDFSPLDLQWLLELPEAARSVSLAGDTAQRMMLHSGFDTWEDALRRLGLEGTPISPLRVGYRSTEEIMAFANHVLGPLRPDRPWLAVRQGLPVELLALAEPGQAVARLADALQALVTAEPRAYVALIARHPAQADLYFEGLSRADIPRLRRVREQDFAFEPGVEVTDVLQVKGLEFDYVILLDVDAATYPDDPASRYLLHIAATRAAHQLWLVVCREPSPLLPPDLTELAENSPAS